jgi:small-conductance mechanosensitive channel
MKELRRLLIGAASAATWPIYLVLAAYLAKVAPWPRDLAWPSCWLLLGLAAGLFVANSGRMAFRKRGWAEEVLLAPCDVCRQLRRVALTLAIAGFGLLMPRFLLMEGLIAPSGRPISATALSRLLAVGFELTCWVLAYRLLRAKSPLLNWLGQEPSRLGWAGRHRRVITSSIMTALGLVLGLDVAGFHFTSMRLTLGGFWTLTLAALCWGAHRLLLHLIDHEAWRWKKAEPDQAPTDAAPEAVTDDAGAKLRTLAKVVITLLGGLGLAWAWNVDLALFHYLSEQKLWNLADTAVNVGDVCKMSLLLFLTAGIWRYLHTFFTVAIFPRMPDDPGIRFAVVTLCRYLVLAVGLLAGLSAIHLGLERIGVVLAALGVGLGFGLQEIVSNFVSGIILLLERPIRVGDIVTVADMTGKVDQINIRATTIINGDNQSMIIPNRQFITGNLINWTHKDKIMRVSIKVNVALGTEADKVTDLLLSIAHADPDVLNNPVPSALLDSIGDASLQFVLNAFVPEPSLMGRVKHRLYGEIQRRFEALEIVIPLPMQELRIHAMNAAARDHAEASRPSHQRWDDAETVPPAPKLATKIPLPVPAENCHRGVDE